MILAAKINNNPLVDKEKLAQGVASFKSGFKQMWADNENTGWNNIENVANLEILIDKFKEYCSQLDQTAQKEQQVKQAQNAFLIDQLGTKPPVAAYVVANPYASYGYYGSGCGTAYYNTGCGCN